MPGWANGCCGRADNDVLMEVWHNRPRAAWDATLAALCVADIKAMIIADEQALFDRSRSRFPDRRA